jgi:hypothetical protein
MAEYFEQTGKNPWCQTPGRRMLKVDGGGGNITRQGSE